MQDSQSHVDVEMPAEAADMNSIYEESLANLRDRIPVDHGNAKKVGQTIAEKEQAAKMYYTNVKTNVLLAWVLSNVSFGSLVTKFCLNFSFLLGNAHLRNPKRTKCPGRFWTRPGIDKNQGISRVYYGLHCVNELRGMSVI